MSWSYSGDPSDSDLDATRFYLGDTDVNDQQLQDEEIQFFIGKLTALYGDSTDNPFVTILDAAMLADILALRYAREVDISADGVSVSVGQLANKYTVLAGSLREMYQNLAGVGGAPIIGGIDRWFDYDPSVKPYVFAMRMHDNYRVGAQSFEPYPWGPNPENYEDGGYWSGD